MSEMHCRECGVTIQKRPPLLCRACSNAYQRAWRTLRAAEGRPVKPSKTWAPEKQAAWTARRRGSEEARALKRRINAAYRVRPQHHEKIRARDKVYHAIKRGRLVRGACEVCGAVKAQAHHDDYSQPLAVRWLCPKHHHEADRVKCELVSREVQDEKRSA